MPEQAYLFGKPEEHEIRVHRPSDTADKQLHATHENARQLLLPGMEDAFGDPESANLISVTTETVTEKTLSEREMAIAELLENLDGMDSYTLTRSLSRLGMSPKEIYPELLHLMADRRKGFQILLNLVRLGCMPTDEDRKVIAGVAYTALQAGEITAMETAEVVDSLGIPLQPGKGKYRKMNGLIRQFNETIDGFHACLENNSEYWKEILQLMLLEKISTIQEAQSIHRIRNMELFRKTATA